MALSDLGRLAEARRHLLHALELAPRHTNALVALGVAAERGRDSEEALDYLGRAVEQDPGNPDAQRNLGVVLANRGRYGEAEPHFRTAYALAPDDPLNVHGLAMALAELGGPERLQEADALYQRVITLDPDTSLAERARQARSALAQRSFRGTGRTERLDAVMYCLSALERFAGMSPERVRAIALEIAVLGRSGLDINNPETRYQLTNLPGDFSGLQLMALLYVAFKQIAPDVEAGFDLAREYEAALSLHRRRPQP
jgi:tetratricopeptide (TPR) repeat protein